VWDIAFTRLTLSYHLQRDAPHWFNTGFPARLSGQTARNDVRFAQAMGTSSAKAVQDEP